MKKRGIILAAVAAAPARLEIAMSTGVCGGSGGHRRGCFRPRTLVERRNGEPEGRHNVRKRRRGNRLMSRRISPCQRAKILAARAARVCSVRQHTPPAPHASLAFPPPNRSGRGGRRLSPALTRRGRQRATAETAVAHAHAKSRVRAGDSGTAVAAALT